MTPPIQPVIVAGVCCCVIPALYIAAHAPAILETIMERWQRWSRA